MVENHVGKGVQEKNFARVARGHVTVVVGGQVGVVVVDDHVGKEPGQGSS